jgi:cytoskeletal protein RodZ
LNNNGIERQSQPGTEGTKAKVSIKTKKSEGFAFSADDVTAVKTQHSENIKTQTLQRKKGASIPLIILLVAALIVVALIVVVLLFQFFRQLERSDKNFSNEMKIVEQEIILDKRMKQEKEEEEKKKAEKGAPKENDAAP